MSAERLPMLPESGFTPPPQGYGRVRAAVAAVLLLATACVLAVVAAIGGGGGVRGVQAMSPGSVQPTTLNDECSGKPAMKALHVLRKVISVYEWDGFVDVACGKSTYNREMDLDCGALHDEAWEHLPFGTDRAQALATLLTSDGMVGLPELGLRGCLLSVESTDAITKVFPKLRHLRRLRIGQNGLGDKNAEAFRVIAAALPQLPALEYFGSDNNCPFTQGAEALAEVLPEMHSLKELSIPYNDILAGGAVSLAKAFPLMASLERIDLCTNQLGSQDARAIAEAIPECKNLRSLNLGCNDFNRSDGKLLTSAWAHASKPTSGLSLPHFWD